jgi:glycosyltransferase involved in cell wall biosynthesis
MMTKKPKIIFVVNEDWAFMTLRLPMAKAALAMGGEVIVATRVNEHRAVMEDMGFRVAHVPFERGGINPFKELSVVWQLARLFRAERPDIIHTIALKAILDGSIAALAVPKATVINTFTGMGAVFIGSSGLGLVRKFLISAFHLLMGRNKAHVIVQNKDDLVLLLELGIARAQRTVLIAGSGVNMQEFPVTPEPTGTPVVTMVARLLWDKGMGELVSAAKLLVERGCEVKIQVVGDPDPQNPQSVDETTLQGWKTEGVVDFLGHCTDIATIWKNSHIAILPSYREGLPKSLLEAASCGRALIATDVPGCRELVIDGENGLLVPARDAKSLADAIERLVNDAELRVELGVGARKSVENSYADTVVMAAVRKLYGDVI